MLRTPENVRLRSGVPGDEGVLLQLIGELAETEGLADQLRATRHALAEELSRLSPIGRFILAEMEGEPVGFCAWYHAFSTFEGCATLFIEDVYVRPGARRRGIGSALFALVARTAEVEGCPRIEWRVQRANADATAFFAGRRLKVVDDWRFCRVTPRKLLSV